MSLRLISRFSLAFTLSLGAMAGISGSGLGVEPASAAVITCTLVAETPNLDRFGEVDFEGWQFCTLTNWQEVTVFGEIKQCSWGIFCGWNVWEPEGTCAQWIREQRCHNPGPAKDGKHSYRSRTFASYTDLDGTVYNSDTLTSWTAKLEG